MLKTARAVAGITFEAGLPMSIVETCKRRRLEMLGAAVELGRGQRVQHRHEAMRRVVGEMRVGGMALHAVDGRAGRSCCRAGRS